CHANLQIVLETFSHAQPASKYSLSNGAETALTDQSYSVRINSRTIRSPVSARAISDNARRYWLRPADIARAVSLPHSPPRFSKVLLQDRLLVCPQDHLTTWEYVPILFPFSREQEQCD
ncbi:hypothetical protein CN105_34670, partial [Sinorhizobium meliloti]